MFSGTIKKKKKKIVLLLQCLLSVCHLLSFRFLLYPLVHTTLEIFSRNVAQPRYLFPLFFSWLVALQEGATWPRTSLPPTEPRGPPPPHTLLSSFSVSALTSWTNAIQRKETQEASFPRSRGSENTASVLDEQCGGIFTQSWSPGSIFQPPTLLLKASRCSAPRPRNVALAVFNLPSPPFPSVGSFELLLLLFSPFCHFSFLT